MFGSKTTVLQMPFSPRLMPNSASKVLTPVTSLTNNLLRTNLLSSAPKRLIRDREEDCIFPASKRRCLNQSSEFNSYFDLKERRPVRGIGKSFADRHSTFTLLLSKDDQENAGISKVQHTPVNKSDDITINSSINSSADERRPLKDISNRTRRSLFSSPSKKSTKDSPVLSGVDIQRAGTVELDLDSKDSGFSGSEIKCDESLVEPLAGTPPKLHVDENSNMCPMELCIDNESFLGMPETKSGSVAVPSLTILAQSNTASHKTREQDRNDGRKLLSLVSEYGGSFGKDSEIMDDLDLLIDETPEVSDGKMDALLSLPLNRSKSLCKKVRFDLDAVKTGPLLPLNDDSEMIANCSRTLHAKSVMLASDMVYSPCAASSSKPIKRRALSLFSRSVSINAGSSTTSSGRDFKRPLPPSQSHGDKKRMKFSTITSTPILSSNIKERHTKSPLAMMSLSDSSCDEDSDSFMNLPAIGAKKSPKIADLLSSVAEASPDFFQPTALALKRTQSVYVPNPVKICASPEVEAKLSNFYQRSMSESHLAVMKAINLSQDSEVPLTGDTKNPLCLPVLGFSRHSDLRSITPATLVDLINNKYQDTVDSFEILDCRYSFEYEGGHIDGAQNWDTPKYVMDRIQSFANTKPQAVDPAKRKILIFHCEFSAERAPRNQKLLREEDRSMNKEIYPFLHFPELYLLEGGYKAFYEKFPEYCSPMSYIKMVDSDYGTLMRSCRSQVKRWAEENKISKSRSGFFGKRTSSFRRQ